MEKRRFLSCLLGSLVVSLLLSACGDAASNTSGSAPAVDYAQAPLAGAEPSDAAPAAAPTTSAAAAAPSTSAAELAELSEAEALALASDPRPAIPMVDTTQDSLSTFALDVDTASYSSARGNLERGQAPPDFTIRTEEFVNYFNYDYPQPENSVFGIHIDAASSPWHGDNTKLLRIGIQALDIDASQRQPAHLTFVIDASGSMRERYRMPLVRQSLTLLVDELREGDTVAIVVYDDNARVLLEPTSISERDTILDALNKLETSGSTNVEAGLRLGYQLASESFEDNAINRIILCSDGIANVGAIDPEGILKEIRDYVKQGIYLSTIGFGMEYNHYLMEQLADNGNGNYAYVDSLKEAERIFIENLTGMLQVVAKDAKVQVEFNPEVVSSYRLLGYENRAIADNDFRNDSVDAGEIGVGHSATAIYEVELTGQGEGRALTVNLRWEDPSTGQINELSQDFESGAISDDFSSMPPRFQQAATVAALAELLRKNTSYPLRPSIEILKRITPELSNDQELQELFDLVLRLEIVLSREDG